MSRLQRYFILERAMKACDDVDDEFGTELADRIRDMMDPIWNAFDEAEYAELQQIFRNRLTETENK